MLEDGGLVLPKHNNVLANTCRVSDSALLTGVKRTLTTI